MKKTIILCILFILLGFIIGLNIFHKNTNSSNNTYYFLQEGVYSNDELLESNLSNLKQKRMEYKKNKIYIYVGITKDIEVAEIIMNIYEKNNKTLTLEEKKINSEELQINIEQFDLLIKKSTAEEEILKIEEVVLANYDEIIKNGE